MNKTKVKKIFFTGQTSSDQDKKIHNVHIVVGEYKFPAGWVSFITTAFQNDSNSDWKVGIVRQFTISAQHGAVIEGNNILLNEDQKFVKFVVEEVKKHQEKQ